MNWEAIGAVAELLASTFVLVTLVYLALQMRKTHQIALATLYQMRADAAREVTLVPVMSASLEGALRRLEAGEKVSVVDERLMNSHMFALFNHFESSHFLNQSGFLSDEHWESDLATISMMIRQNPSMVGFWASVKTGFRESFVHSVDGILQKDEKPGA